MDTKEALVKSLIEAGQRVNTESFIYDKATKHAMSAVAYTLLRFNTPAALKHALGAAFQLTKHYDSKVDLGFRHLAPSIQLCLDMDQECYDYCKGFVTVIPQYHAGGLQSPVWLSLDNEDAFEELPSLIYPRGPDNFMFFFIMLVKVRLLLDLQAMRRATREVGSRVPREVLDEIRFYCVGNAVSRHRNLIQQDDDSSQIEAMEVQIRQLFDHTRGHIDPAFWTKFVKEKHGPKKFPPPQDLDRKRLFEYCWAPWLQTPGALAVLQELADEYIGLVYLFTDISRCGLKSWGMICKRATRGTTK
ncbi:hypothetical protein NX059_001572 [Plenodomus lindquistii]|nr:hypothetical protein NX059_001572 [Plenodomus lindquistii]